MSTAPGRLEPDCSHRPPPRPASPSAPAVRLAARSFGPEASGASKPGTPTVGRSPAARTMLTRDALLERPCLVRGHRRPGPHPVEELRQYFGAAHDPWAGTVEVRGAVQDPDVAGPYGGQSLPARQ